MSRSNILTSQATWFKLKSRLQDFGFYLDSEVSYANIEDTVVVHGWVEYQLIDEDEFEDMVRDFED